MGAMSDLAWLRHLRTVVEITISGAEFPFGVAFFLVLFCKLASGVLHLALLYAILVLL